MKRPCGETQLFIEVIQLVHRGIAQLWSDYFSMKAVHQFIVDLCFFLAKINVFQTFFCFSKLLNSSFILIA